MFTRRLRPADLRGATEAELAARLFESFGIAKARIVLEDKSRDTVENARFTKELVQPKPGERWLLVTSAHHMPRSVGVFRAAGFPVEAFPVDYRTRGAIDMLRPFSPLGDGLRRTDTAMREWVGLVRLPADRADRRSCFRRHRLAAARFPLDKANDRAISSAMIDLAKGDRTRARILDEAVELASVQGLGGLTIGPLADRLGLSKSGLFAHFRPRRRCRSRRSTGRRIASAPK